MPLSKETRKYIGEKLDAKIKDMKCPMCGNSRFYISDGYSVIPLYDSVRKARETGMAQGIPAIPIMCCECGFISQHALAVLEIEVE